MGNRALSSRRETSIQRQAEPKTPWWRESGWVATIALAAGILGSTVTFFAKTLPELGKIRQEVRGLNVTMRNESAQAKVAEITAEDLIDPARKAASDLALRTARLQFAKAADELLDASTPDLRAETMQGMSEDGMLAIPLILKNGGSRGLWLSNLKILVKFTAADGPKTPKYSTDKCSLGYLPPGSSIPCHFVLRVDGGADDIERIDYTYMIDARPYLVEASQSYALLLENYPKDLLEKRLFRRWTFSGWYIEG